MIKVVLTNQELYEVSGTSPESGASSAHSGDIIHALRVGEAVHAVRGTRPVENAVGTIKVIRFNRDHIVYTVEA